MGRPLPGACAQRLALSAGMARAKGVAARAWCVLCNVGISLLVALDFKTDAESATSMRGTADWAIILVVELPVARERSGIEPY